MTARGETRSSAAAAAGATVTMAALAVTAVAAARAAPAAAAGTAATRAAALGLLRDLVGIVDMEAGAHGSLDVVELRALERLEVGLGKEDLDAVLFDDDVVGLTMLRKGEHVAGAA